MKQSLNIAFFGSSLVSSYWNGAATYYRGLIRALHGRGHHVTFYEPDAFDRQAHQDLPTPLFARSVVYAPTSSSAWQAIEEARGADLVVKASGVGVLDEFLEEALLDLRTPDTRVVFWDVDAPATLDRIQATPRDPFRALIPEYDLIFTYGGGSAVIDAYAQLGAPRCIPIYNALDTTTHHPSWPDPRFEGLLGFLGNRLPDRESRIHEFFLRPAQDLASHRFLLGGSGWPKELPGTGNVTCLGHVYTYDHNAFNCTVRAVLNINRESMARYGYSPPTRIFEAAGAGACLITDAWQGIEAFLEPDSECLVANSGDEVTELLSKLTEAEARKIGKAALHRVLQEHTYERRSVEIEEALFQKPRHRSGPSLCPPSLPARSSSAQPLRIVVLGLSITSSWGNGHATTYRALLRQLATLGHDVLFLERNTEWYAPHRDLAQPSYCSLALYESLDELQAEYGREVADASLVIVGSFVPEGIAVGEWVQRISNGLVAFYDIDTPVTLAKLHKNECAYLSKPLIPGYDLYLSFSGGSTLSRLEGIYGAKQARALYCSVDPELYYPEPVYRPRWDLGYLGTYSEDRQPSLERLLIAPARLCPSSRIVVAGPQYPEEICWPANTDRIEHLPPTDHRQFYNAQRFTLNVTRGEMIKLGYAPSVRLFEAAACGVPIISDWWEGLDTFFVPGREILISHTPQQTLRFLHDLSDEERLDISKRARARVLKEHSAQRRAEELIEFYTEALAGIC